MKLDGAARVLKEGRVAVFPTDTVYGLGVAVDFAESPRDLYRIKGRDDGKPVAWLVGGESDLMRYGSDVAPYAVVLARAFWPGPLTLIVRASAAVAPGFLPAGSAGGGREATIGLRMPHSAVALGLIQAVGCPLATTSANLSGNPAVSRFADIDPAVLAAADAVIKGEELEDAVREAVASTVVDCTGAAPVVLREGRITAAQIEGALTV